MIVDEIDWTGAWSKKYPVLASYQGIEGIESYREQISKMYDNFKNEFELSDMDTVLILKDILYQKYRTVQKKANSNNYILYHKESSSCTFFNVFLALTF